MLEFLHNYFDSSTKLFSNLHLDKFLDISAKSFFPHSNQPALFLSPNNKTNFGFLFYIFSHLLIFYLYNDILFIYLFK